MNAYLETNWLARFARNSYSSFLGYLATAYAHLTKPTYGKYDLSHLVQSDNQQVQGPVQDDEALLLYAVVRGMRMRSVLEVGGLSGFSALNFVRALPPKSKGFVLTIDIDPVRKVADNHHTIIKPAQNVTADDLRPIFGNYEGIDCFDMLFFDAHHYEGQMGLLKNLQDVGLVNDDTILAFHDTDLHPSPCSLICKPAQDDSGKKGFLITEIERQMVRALSDEYEFFQLHPPFNHIKDGFKFRHGITLLQKKKL